jgi:hypothetical protein
MPSKKEYKIRFYSGNSISSTTHPALSIAKILETEIKHQASNQPPRSHLVAGRLVDLTNLVSLNNGNVYKGVIRLLRDEAPYKRDLKGKESQINLLAGETIIEKNHFLFYNSNNLLVWQTNRQACHHSSLAGLLTFLTNCNSTVSFSDILNKTALTKIDSGELKKIHVKFAAPKNAQLYDPHDWTNMARKFASNADNAEVSLEISVGKSNKRLPEKFKSSLKELIPNGHGEILAIHASVYGEKEPIDLLGDCIKDKMIVSLFNGHYPSSTEVFTALENAKRNQQSSLDDFFGK